MEQPANSFDALVLALQLAITAPDDAKAAKCQRLAEGIAANMPELEVARAKKLALDGIK